MNWLNSIFIFGAAWVMIFLESWLQWPRNFFGTSFALLPGLMVYAGLTRDVPMITAVSLISGLCFDAMSANPLGVSILPLFLIAFIIFQCRELLLRENTFAQMVLGAGAAVFYQLMTLFLVCSVGISPLLGWKTIWHIFVALVSGGLATPVLFILFDRLDQALNYRPRVETSFRPDREIKRGRA